MRISDWSSDVCSSDLTGAGLPCRPMGGEGGSVARPNIFDISEAAAARAGDLLIEFVDGAPSLILGGDAEPARLRFGFEDMAFGHALAAEPVRPANRPETGRASCRERVCQYV